MLGKLEDSTLGARVGQESFTEQLGQWWTMTQGQARLRRAESQRVKLHRTAPAHSKERQGEDGQQEDEQQFVELGRWLSQ